MAVDTRGLLTTYVRAISTQTYRAAMFSVDYRWTLLGLNVVGVGIASMQYPQIPQWVLLVEAALSVLLISIEIIKNVQERRRVHFVERSMDPYDDVYLRTGSNDDVRVLRTNAGTFLHDIHTSAQMRLHRTSVVLSPVPFTVPVEVKPYARRFLKRVLATQRGRFNGPCLGWNTNLSDFDWAHDNLVVHRGRHFDQLQTDDLAMHDVEVDGRTLDYLGQVLYINSAGQVRDFATSWLFNIIGASTLAITSDGKLVRVDQTAANNSSPGLIAPSGSGSVEPRDLSGFGFTTIRDLAVRASTRELCEEVNLDTYEVLDEDSYLLGYGRWMNKAARGELCCLTFLSLSSDEIDRRPVRQAEGIYTRKAQCIRFASSLLSWDPKNPGAMLPPGDRGRMSVPLAAALSMLAEVSRENSEVGRRIRSTFA